MIDQVLRFSEKDAPKYVEIESDGSFINVAICSYGEWHMVDLRQSDVQRLYDYLGEWLAARQTQTTGLGDK